MITRNSTSAENEPLLRLFNGVHTGLVLFGVLLFGIGIALSLATSGVISPDMPSAGSDDTTGDDDTDDGDGSDADDGDGDGADTSDGDDADVDDTDDGGGDDTGADDGGGAESDDAEDTAGDDDTDDADADDEEEADEPDTSLLSLTVVGPAGEPIEAVNVSGEGEPHEADIPLEFSGETDDDGTYTDEIYENEYDIELDHPDYEPATVEHDHDGESELVVELERESDDDTPDTSLLTLSVVDEDGEPIEGANVSGEGEPHEADIPLEFSGETDDDGTYTDEIYENEYDIEVDHPDYESVSGTYTHEGDQEVIVELESDD